MSYKIEGDFNFVFNFFFFGPIRFLRDFFHKIEGELSISDVFIFKRKIIYKIEGELSIFYYFTSFLS